MPLLEYKQWRRFNNAIERAMITCQNSGNVVNAHFANIDQMQQIGDSQAKRLVITDVKLTRYACYLIAMNGDSRKTAIAQAQTYFAVKTREAEVKIPQQNNRIKELELELQLMQIKERYMNKREAICQLQGEQMLALLDGRPDAIVEVKETITETVICRNGRNVNFVGKSTAELGKELGFKTGKELETWLIRNKADHLICQGMRAIQADYIPEENVKEVKRLFAIKRNKVQRQILIGE
jgi:hypothetical protein